MRNAEGPKYIPEIVDQCKRDVAAINDIKAGLPQTSSRHLVATRSMNEMNKPEDLMGKCSAKSVAWKLILVSLGRFDLFLSRITALTHLPIRGAKSSHLVLASSHCLAHTYANMDSKALLGAAAWHIVHLSIPNPRCCYLTRLCVEHAYYTQRCRERSQTLICCQVESLSAVALFQQVSVWSTSLEGYSGLPDSRPTQ